MFGNMGNMQGMMKKVQKMQADMLKKQEELNKMTVEAVAGGGAVKVTTSGRKEILSVTIDPTAFDPEDIEMLQDLILVAVNDSLKQVDQLAEVEMGKITKGVNLPPGF